MNQYDFFAEAKAYVTNKYGKDRVQSYIENSLNEKSLLLQIDIGEIEFYHDEKQDNEWCKVRYPYFDRKSNKILEYFTLSHHMLNIEIKPNGDVLVYYEGSWADGDMDLIADQEYYPCFSLNINSVEGIKEVIDFTIEVAINLDFKFVDKFQFKDIPLSNLLEDIFVYIPSFSKELLPYKDFTDNFSFDQVTKYVSWQQKAIDKYLSSDKKDEIKNLKQTYIELLSRNNSTLFKYGDIGCTYKEENKDSNFTYADTISVNKDTNNEIALVFRVNKDTSYFAFLDFLKKSIEGKELAKNCFENKVPPSIVFIEDKYIQLQYMLEKQIYEHNMLSELKSRLNKREPFKNK